ncbi:protein adenylyltransferase SelO [Sodalinema gerasimenkoae]|uniref:protein adenylyltransferase SelO n=1 Tax=Sodalinema gerasimenkoae TaxID=2862348 RepID=UPI00135ADD5A|nr:YdiU family protein [Sodalinema gerasimenkoae]
MTVPESSQSPVSRNPFLSLEYETALESLGDDYYDLVEAADFPTHILRFRGDRLLPKLGLDPKQVSDDHFIESFGKFGSSRPFLALCYHGYQFGEYNPRLGDGRGFLYGQVRGTDGKLYDFGTKGSGTTPYSRGGDGRLTLKGGVREIIASETLARLGVNTSRCLSVIETGEQLWRGDEPSPTRSCVMVRLSQSHIRFGTFERLHYLRRKDLSKTLLDHVMDVYYPHIDRQQPQAYLQFYRELVDRTAKLAAQWMVAGFCHAVLNTDNMSITGESFDYGPYAFIPSYDPKFTAAYFDYYGRYSYGNQPLVCKLNLELLQQPLSGVTPDLTPEAMSEALKEFDRSYETNYRQGMLRRLGLLNLDETDGRELVKLTVDLLRDNEVGYHDFFSQLRQQFSPEWRDNPDAIFAKADPPQILQPWTALYHRFLQAYSTTELKDIQSHLAAVNPNQIPIRPEIEAIWEPITQADNWQPFYDFLDRIWA